MNYKRYKQNLILIIFIILVGCSSKTVENDQKNEISSLRVEQKQKETQKVEKEITISAVGDILIHDRVYHDAKVETEYDFSPMLKQVKDYLNDATITFANQETMIGGTSLGLSGYPTFNSPHEVGDALKEVGINVVSLSNNHTLDRGEEAIQSAIKHWEEIDMMYVGAYKDQLDRNDIRIIETNEDISVAFLAYSYGTNGIHVPDGKDYLVNLIDKDVMKKDIAEAKQHADVIVLSLHFGNEYERMPSEEQKDLAQFAADQGVHAVLGHHPHVLQPIEWVKGKEGNETLVAYSLGNFLSGQYELHRRIGGVLTFSIHKTIEEDTERIKIKSPQFMPTYVHDENETDYRVIPMALVSDHQLENATEHYEEIKSHVSQWVPEIEFVEETSIDR